MNSCNLISHILQYCFTGTVIKLFSASEVILKDIGEIVDSEPRQNTQCKQSLYFLGYAVVKWLPQHSPL